MSLGRLAVVAAALRRPLRPARGSRRGSCDRRERRHREVRGRRGRRLLRADGRVGPAPIGADRTLPAVAAGADPESGRARQGRRECKRRRARRRAGRLPVSATRARRGDRLAGGLRGVVDHPRRPLSAGASVRRRQRAESGGIPASAVREEREERLGRDCRPVPGRGLRRAQGRRSRHHRRRCRALAARKRRPACTEQPVRLARCGSSRRSAAGTGRVAARRR